MEAVNQVDVVKFHVDAKRGTEAILGWYLCEKHVEEILLGRRIVKPEDETTATNVRDTVTRILKKA